LDAGDLVWAGLFAVGLALAVIQFWIRSKRLKRTDRP
jgi:hypothetical protein